METLKSLHLNDKPQTMTSSEILKADLLDLLFENRNKSYGAYPLRKYYASRLTLSLSISFGIFLLAFLAFRPHHQPNTGWTAAGPVMVSPPIEIPRLELPKPARQATSTQKVAQEKFVSQIEIVPNKTIKQTDLPPQTDIQNAAISDINMEGPALTGAHQPALIENKKGLLDGSGDTNENKEFIAVEKQPEFPGGQQAWINFLQKHLQTPDALQPGEKRVVMVRFAVAVDGSVTQFEIVQSGGNAFDQEVIRVLKKMPKWKPAVQNGHNVPVLFTQPVTFIGAEE